MLYFIFKITCIVGERKCQAKGNAESLKRRRCKMLQTANPEEADGHHHQAADEENGRGLGE